MDTICFHCSKPIESLKLAVRLTQRDNPERKEYLHRECFKRIIDRQTDKYCSDIINKFINQ